MPTTKVVILLHIASHVCAKSPCVYGNLFMATAQIQKEREYLSCLLAYF